MKIERNTVSDLEIEAALDATLKSVVMQVVRMAEGISDKVLDKDIDMSPYQLQHTKGEIFLWHGASILGTITFKFPDDDYENIKAVFEPNPIYL